MKSKMQSKSYVSKSLDISNSTNKKLGVRRSYDILGSIAIIDFNGTRKEELRFAREILARHKMVKTILAKAGAVKGKYRTRSFRHVLGERNFIADYKENNCRFRFDVRKTFFSNRLSFERSRISSLVKDGEKVIVMFAGIGPYAIQIAKAHKKAEVVAIELNSYACRAMKENMVLNKVQNIIVEHGDVKKVAKKYKGFADRIIAPMPSKSLDFLDEILLASKKKGIVHLYAFGPTSSAFGDVAKALMAHSKANRYTARVLFKRVARNYSPKEIEVVLDYRIVKL